MSIDPGGIVPLQSPIQTFEQGDLQATARQIKAEQPDMPFSVDEIVTQLEYMQRNGIALDQKHIDDLKAGEPVIPRPELDGAFRTALTDIKTMKETNPWFNANPITVFFEMYINLAHMLSQIKLTEAQEASEAIVQMSETASDIAQMIRDIGYQEAVANFVSAGVSAASGAIKIGGGAWARNKAGKAYTKDSGLALQSYTMQVDGVSQLFDAGDKIAKGVTSLKKASLEAMKTITENLLKTYERKLSSALEAYKTNDEMIQQLLQNLQKVIDEAYKAHGFSRQ